MADDFHDRTTTPSTISSNEDDQNIQKLSKLNDQLGTQFLYTVIRDQNGTYRLTSSSALASEIKDHTEVHYFTAYPDASNTIKTSLDMPRTDLNEINKIYKPLYVPIFSDRWVTYRSVVIPMRTAKGNLYIVGADMDISHVNKLLRHNLLQTLFSFILFLIAVFPIVMLYTLILKHKQKEYKEVHQLYVDQSKRSITDPLTQLANRYKLDQELQLQYQNYQRDNTLFALLVIDLDHFKSINDTYGHQTGDKVLQLVANILKDSSRSSDTVGRWGGEEFMIIYPNSDLENGYLLAEKLRLAIQNSQELQHYGLTISIGVNTIQENLSLKEFLRSVDKALYKAKELGRNQTVKAE